VAGRRLTVQVQTQGEEHFQPNDTVEVSWSPSAAIMLED
jgi:hypothetical protein